MLAARHDGDYVFPGSPQRRGDHAVTAAERFIPGAKGYPLDRNCLQLCFHSLGYPDYDVHALRSTFIGWAKANGYPYEVREASLDHVVGSKTSRDYDHEALVAQRREMLDCWSTFCAGGHPLTPAVVAARATAKAAEEITAEETAALTAPNVVRLADWRQTT